MKRNWVFIFLISVLSFSSVRGVVVSKDTLMMGSAFSFTAVHDDANKAWEGILEGMAEVNRIEMLISSWKENSETSKVNANAGIKPVRVSNELFDLVTRAKKVSAISDGYFDISYASLDKVWNFDGSQVDLPSETQIANSIRNINYENIILSKEEKTIFLKEKGMKIGFGAIGKGYAADRAKAVMTSFGIASGLVNAGGDLISWGSKPEGDPWTIAIADPKNKSKIISWLNISDKAVVTSGNYEKYIEINGERFCHIINPNTGWPVKNMASVTVITTNAELADALATTVFVLGEKEGMALINHLEGVEGIIVNSDFKSSYSKNIKLNIVNNEEN